MEFSVSPMLLALMPIVVALVQLIKLYVNNRYAPLISLLLGIGGAFLVDGVSTIAVTLISGIVVGLSASGLYSGGKALVATDNYISER